MSDLAILIVLHESILTTLDRLHLIAYYISPVGPRQGSIRLLNQNPHAACFLIECGMRQSNPENHGQN